MSSLIWYIYDFARKAWIDGFVDAKSHKEDIVEKPDRFRDFPLVIPENCIGCGSCTASCPSPTAIKLVRDEDTAESVGLIYPVINKNACIRCGFCAEVCPSSPKTLECGENHFIQEEFNIIPSKRKFIIDDYLCINCDKCVDACEVAAIEKINGRNTVNQAKCISCGKCLDACPVKGAMKGVYVNNLEEQKKIINMVVNTLEKHIESKKESLDEISDDRLYLSEIKFQPLYDKALEILNDKEIVYDVLEDAIDRLNIRVIIWDSDECKKCQLCIPDCPTGAIDFDYEKDTIVRDDNKCLRCSICYQSCPFGAIKYFMAKFNLDTNNAGEKVVHISVKASPLAKARRH